MPNLPPSKTRFIAFLLELDSGIGCPRHGATASAKTKVMELTDLRTDLWQRKGLGSEMMGMLLKYGKHPAAFKKCVKKTIGKHSETVMKAIIASPPRGKLEELFLFSIC